MLKLFEFGNTLITQWAYLSKYMKALKQRSTGKSTTKIVYVTEMGKLSLSNK